MLLYQQHMEHWQQRPLGFLQPLSADLRPCRVRRRRKNTPTSRRLGWRALAPAAVWVMRPRSRCSTCGHTRCLGFVVPVRCVSARQRARARLVAAIVRAVGPALWCEIMRWAMQRFFNFVKKPKGCVRVVRCADLP